MRARPHLVNLLDAARRVGQDLATAASGEGIEAANRLVQETGAVLTWPLADPCPDPDADIELRASIGVFRNAAFAFRRLARSAPRTRNSQLRKSCEALLGQGHHHLQSFEELTGPLDL